jgi:hypothetical protein
MNFWSSLLWRLFGRVPCRRRRVLVNLVDGEAIDGVLFDHTGAWLVLKDGATRPRREDAESGGRGCRDRMRKGRLHTSRVLLILMAILVEPGVADRSPPPRRRPRCRRSTSGPFFDGYRRTYAQIYRTQPAVRTVIDFFARNIAQLGCTASTASTTPTGSASAPSTPSRGSSSARTTRPPGTGSSITPSRTSARTRTGTGGSSAAARQPADGLVRLPAGEVSVARRAAAHAATCGRRATA